MSKLNSQTSQEQVAELIQDIEVKSLIAMQKSMKDGNPKHHKEFTAEATSKINKLLIEARIDELKRLYLVYGSKDAPASLDNLFSLGKKDEAPATPIKERLNQLQANIKEEK